MINSLNLIIGSLILIFLLVNAAVLNVLLSERDKVKNAWENAINAYSLRSDILPLLLITFQEYKKLDPKSLKALLNQRHLCHKETNAQKRINFEVKLDNFIDQIINEAEKTPKLKNDIDFLEIKNILIEKRSLIESALNMRKLLIDTFNTRLAGWYSQIVRIVFRVRSLT